MFSVNKKNLKGIGERGKINANIDSFNRGFHISKSGNHHNLATYGDSCLKRDPNTIRAR